MRRAAPLADSFVGTGVSFVVLAGGASATDLAWVAVAVTALIFGAAHVGATYVSPAEQLLFAAIVVGLGAILAWATQWGNALWGAVLFHMGVDLIVVVEST